MDSKRRKVTTTVPSATADRQLEATRPSIVIGERVGARRRLELARLGLGHLWASRRPWDRLELGAARVREATGRHQLLVAFTGTWNVERPQASLRRGELPAELEDPQVGEGPSGAAVAWLELVLALEALGLVAWAWWR